MTTLTVLKARIADDLDRTDISSQIASAITDAIEHYKNDRLFFNETRSSTFVTVAAQSRYTVADDTDIPLWFDLDAVFMTDSTREIDMAQYDPVQMEYLLGQTSPGSGLPYAYAYFDSSFWFYPVPDDVYTVRPMGAIEKAAPASDGETGNVWMTEAFELIRCRAKVYLAAHVINDPNLAMIMTQAEQSALERLQRKTSKRIATGRIEPTAW